MKALRSHKAITDKEMDHPDFEQEMLKRGVRISDCYESYGVLSFSDDAYDLEYSWHSDTGVLDSVPVDQTTIDPRNGLDMSPSPQTLAVIPFRLKDAGILDNVAQAIKQSY